jgi:hypothetical protein
MEKIDVACYVQPDRMDPNSPDVDDATNPKSDITYSVVLGYGFSKPPKPRMKKLPVRTKAN